MTFSPTNSLDIPTIYNHLLFRGVSAYEFKSIAVGDRIFASLLKVANGPMSIVMYDPEAEAWVDTVFKVRDEMYHAPTMINAPMLKHWCKPV